MNHQFSLLIKPTSADCNLKCAYCFYLEKKALYADKSRHRMSDEVLEHLIRTYLETPQQHYAFSWQGGEPTMMGPDFFQQIVTFQKKHGKPGSAVSNGLQTNATLIDDQLTKTLKEYRFLVGCSLDGPAELHDHYRKTIDDKPSHPRVIEGIERLKRDGVDFNILTLVSKANVKKAKEVYRYLVDHGYHYHQYIPCVEFDQHGTLEPFAITGQEWGDFLCELYDQWYPGDTRKISIRLFDSILNKNISGTSDVCTMGDNCRQYFVVEYNGDVYPCDFFVDTPYKLGNIMTHSWQELIDAPRYQEFADQKKKWHVACGACEFLSLCQGDCLKFRYQHGYDPGHTSHLCQGWKQFYQHSRNGFNDLENQLKRELMPTESFSTNPPPAKKKAGRNSPCPCGSGMKYKKCCGA